MRNVWILGMTAMATACGLSRGGEGSALPGDAVSSFDGSGVGIESSTLDDGAFSDDASDGTLADDAASDSGVAPDATTTGDSPTGADGPGNPDAPAGDAKSDVGETGPDGGSPDTGTRDAATPDAGSSDAGMDAKGTVDSATDGSMQDSPSDGGGPRPDGSTSDSGACDYVGTWGSRLTIDVSWSPQGLTGIILAPGTGQIKQWIKAVRVVNGASVTDTTVVCGIALPDFRETAIAGSETYGVRFPNTLFDNGLLSTFAVNATVSGFAAGATYKTTATAVLLGLTLAHPATDPWPTTVTTSVDEDRDGNPGITIDVAQGSAYSDIPTQFPALPGTRATELYVAIRQVTVVTGTVDDCDHMSGTITIPPISTSSAGTTTKYAIDSHVLGCMLQSGSNCSTSQASFVDNTQPVFTPSGTTDFHSIRLATGATCADVRSMLP